MIQHFMIFLLFSFCVGAAAEENEAPTPAEIIIEMGNGKVVIESRGIDLDGVTLERLQTDILVHPKLVRQVTGEEPTRVTLSGDDIDILAREIHRHSEKQAEKIKKLLVKDLTANASVGLDDGDPTEGIGIPKGSDKVIFGDDFTVGPLESLNDVVVLGGHVTVAGNVQDLVVLGGSVQLLEGASVENLIVVGGKFEAALGAQIHGDKVLINEFNATQTIDRWMWSRVETFGNHLSHFFLAFLAALLGPWLLRKLVPNYLGRLRERQKQSWFRNIFFGLSLILVSLPLLLLLVISIVGILMIPAYSLGVVLLIMFGYAFAVEGLGLLFFKSRNFSTVAVALLSALIWVIIGLIPVLGFLVRLTLFSIAIAALVLALRESEIQPKNT